MDIQAFFNWLNSLPMDKTITVSEVLSMANETLLEKEDNILPMKVIDYLNSQAGTTFTNKNRKAIQLISARIKEGYTFVDFKIVIDKKCKQWLGTEQAIYLRPITLFNATKFETYLNETEIINSSKENGKRTTKLDKIKSEIEQATRTDWGLD
jgi:uncharacterized phage protein (TIGR02220 family)